MSETPVLSAEGRAPEDHARLSASSAHRWMKCAGSPRMEAGLPDVDTEFNVEGRAAHSLASRLLEKRSRFESDEKVESFLSGVHRVTVRLKEGGVATVMVTDEMRDALLLYARVVREAIAEAPAPVRLYIEQKVSLEMLGPPEPMFGTADVVIIAPGLLHVIDLKYGTGVVVEVQDNPQLLEYALASELSLHPGPGVGSKFRTTIVQPRATHPDGPVRSAEYTIADLRGFGHALMESARAAQGPSAPLTPGPWCRWCKAAAFCPALAEVTRGAAQAEFMEGADVSPPVRTANLSYPTANGDEQGTAPTPGTSLVVIPSAREIAPPDPEHLPMETVLKVLDKAALVDAFMAAVKDRVRRAIMNGESVPGWKIVAGRPVREWVEGAEEALLAAGLEPGELFERKLRSPSQVETIVGKKTLPADLWRKVSKSESLVRESDKRPALPSSAQKEFAALPPGPDSALPTDGEIGDIDES